MSHASLYRAGERGWVKIKPDYWRREAELEAMQWSFERRSRRFAASPRGH